MSEQEKPGENSSSHWKKSLVISTAILMIGVIVATVILYSEPTSKPTGATKQTAMLVEVVKAEKGEFHPQIEALGRVEPALDITLSPRVRGEILKLAPGFIPGGFVSKNETLLQIDPADYENILKERKSELKSAVSQLSIESGRQDVAKKEYQLLDETLSEANKELVLRRPQLNDARADVESAQAAVNQAKLDLNRTQIKAPFDAQVLERHVNIGSQVAPGDNLGRLVGTKEYWVMATVPLSKLPWIKTKENKDKVTEDEFFGPPVKIRNRAAWPKDIFREGYVEKIIGSLDESTRMVRVLVTVPDPLARETKKDHPPIVIGSILQLIIEGKEISDVVRLKRDYIRGRDKVWVMKNDKLDIRTADIIFRDANYAYIRTGVEAGEDIVVTNLATVSEGAELRTEKRKD